MKAGVIVVLYDHRGTLPALLIQLERAVSGQPVQRVGLLAPGGTEEIHILHGEILLAFAASFKRNLMIHFVVKIWNSSKDSSRVGKCSQFVY